MRKWPELSVVLWLLPAAVPARVAQDYKIGTEQQTGITSSVVIDIVSHESDSTAVLMATGRGLNCSFDDGLSWSVHNTTNGLPGENLSAVFSIGSRIWVGSSHDELIGGELWSISDGLTYSDDDGANWTQVNFGPDGLNIPYVWGGERTIYDITGHTDHGFFNCRSADNDAHWLFFAAFAGGLLASQDGGENWQRIFPSPADSAQFNNPYQAPSYRNRYFSCVADTSHGDSLFMWAGTAGGLFQYVYVPPREKLYSHRINRIGLCDTCSVVFVGGENGLSLTQTTGDVFTSRFESDGLGFQEVTALTSIGEYLLVGTADTATGEPRLVVSSDRGESFTAVALPSVFGQSGRVSDFALVDSRLYMAGQEAGLYMSLDSGQSGWTHIWTDPVDTFAATNTVNALAVLSDTLLLGTDSGYVELRLDGTGSILSVFHQPFGEADSSSARIIRVKPQRFVDSLDNVDSTVVWTVHRPVSGSGTPMVGRSQWVIDTSIVGPDTSIDTSLFSQHFQVQAVTYDVNFFGDTAFVVGAEGIRFTTRGTNPANIFSARQYIDDTLVVATLDDDTVTVMEVRGDTVIFGTLNGLAISNDRGIRFSIFRPNTDTLAADYVINHSHFSSAYGLAGDFVPAVGFQYRGSDSGRIWASGRPVDYGSEGISVGEYRTITDQGGDSIGFGLVWQTVHKGDFAWNFEFVGDSVFAATNGGLLFHYGDLDSLDTEWETVPFVDGVTGEVLVDTGISAYGVRVVDSFLWVGTGDGTVRISLGDFSSQQLFSRVDSTTPPDEVYAFPVPFSPLRGQEVDFRFVVPEAGNVTLEIYDFAMNLVARPIDNVFYAAGIYPNGSSQGATWDGYNGKGDRVAVGIYYFKVEFESGETRWGKLAVIP